MLAPLKTRSTPIHRTSSQKVTAPLQTNEVRPNATTPPPRSTHQPASNVTSVNGPMTSIKKTLPSITASNKPAFGFRRASALRQCPSSMRSSSFRWPRTSRSRQRAGYAAYSTSRNRRASRCQMAGEWRMCIGARRSARTSRAVACRDVRGPASTWVRMDSSAQQPVPVPHPAVRRSQHLRTLRRNPSSCRQAWFNERSSRPFIRWRGLMAIPTVLLFGLAVTRSGLACRRPPESDPPPPTPVSCAVRPARAGPSAG